MGSDLSLASLRQAMPQHMCKIAGSENPHTLPNGSGLLTSSDVLSLLQSYCLGKEL